MKATCSKFVGFWHYGVILTYLSVIAAITGICLSFLVSPFWGIVCLLISGVCDAFDGAVASMRKNRSPEDKKFGGQIDSLSDIISFGVAPAIVGFSIGMREWYFIAILCVFVLCALIRLAYYNVTEEVRAEEGAGKRVAFEGLPVTNVAVGLPVFYLVATMFSERLVTNLIMASAYLILSFLFVFRFRMPKAGVRGLLITMGILTALIIGLALIRYYVCGVPLG